jgi:hypothetical protein
MLPLRASRDREVLLVEALGAEAVSHLVLARPAAFGSLAAGDVRRNGTAP